MQEGERGVEGGRLEEEEWREWKRDEKIKRG